MNTRWLDHLARPSRALAVGLLIVASVDAFAQSAGSVVPYAGGAVQSTGGAAQSAVTSAQSDATFLAARAAYEGGDWPTLDTLATALADYPLARYVTFWQLESRIDDAAPQTVHDFISRYPDSPLSVRLEVDWLKSLGKRGDWASFAIDYPPPAGEDAELECYGIQYRWQRDGERALAAAKPLWFTGKSTPESCEPLFTALIAAGDLTLADRRERFRLATASGNLRLAHAIADALPGSARIAAREFAGVDRDPLTAVAKGRFSLRNPGSRELALYALDRAARNDASAARNGWLRWRGRMSRADRDYGNLRVAYRAARQLDPRANAWFREVRDPGPGEGLGPPSPGAVEDWKLWRVRAALRVLAWDDVARAIDALPADVQQQPDWRYWRARSLAARDRGDEARTIYAGLLGDLHYYGLLAAEALGLGAAQIDALKLSDAVNPDPATLDAFGARPGVQRAVKLAELDLRPESLREWAYAIRGLDDDALLVAAHYALKAGLYDRAINTAGKTAARFDFALRYPTPYRSDFASAARDQGLDLGLLYGIARQESRFVADIASAAGAVGLMQLMPGTARWIARQLARDDYAPEQIASADVNTQFGAFYFRYWQDRLDNQPAVAAAAYNAGPRRAQAWRPASGSLEGAIWVETIPYNETRNYVKQVLANTMLYARALGQPYVALTDRLGVVRAIPAESPALAAGEQ